MKKMNIRPLVALLVCALLFTGYAGGSAAASAWTLIAESHLDYEAHMEGFADANYGISVGRYGEIHYTHDGGKTWKEARKNEKCRFVLDIVDDNLAWSGGFGSQICLSRDGGETWDNVSNFPEGGVISNIDFIDDTTGWACNANKLMATNDGGMTWTLIPLPKEADGIAALLLRTATDGYVFSRNGLLLHTTDGGASWAVQDVGIENYNVRNVKNEPGLYKCSSAVADIAFTDDNNGMIVFVGVHPGNGMEVWCLRTSDGGASWAGEQVPVPEGFRPVRLFLSQDGKYLTLGSYSGDMVLLEA